jgi:DNA sulfur modification protein DndD
MPQLLNILGWKAHGLRCPDHEISCADEKGKPYKVSLIQMPNGTGKTTTLSLLRAALSGAASVEVWDNAAISEFQKKGAKRSKAGLFEVRLLLNDKRVTITMNFDFENGRVSYKTTAGSGQKTGFHPPAGFSKFLNPDFVSFFVFDGELAQRLLNRTQTNADEAVDSLFQLSTFSAMQKRTNDYYNEQTKEKSATEERGLTRRVNRVQLLQERLDELKKDQKAHLKRKADLEAKLTRQQEAYEQEITKDAKITKDLNDARVLLETRKADVQAKANDALNTMRDPFTLSVHFAAGMSDLKSGLDRVKLPDSAAREFFNELLDEAECVCGRPIDHLIKETIKARSAQYLGSDDVMFLGSMKTAIQTAIGPSLEAPERNLVRIIAELEEAVAEERNVRNSLDDLERREQDADPAVKKAKEDIDALQADLDKVLDALEKYDNKDDTLSDENTFGLVILKRRHSDAEKKLAEIKGTITLKAKRDALLDILAAAHDRARTAITNDICNETNARIQSLMPHNRIKVERIERSLVLEGQEGGSVGETLSIAYAFLSTLFNRADHQLPFVVDSPAGPIDLAVRPKIAELIPKLSGQFIAFTISSERDQFVAPLKKACKDGIQMLTLFRKGSAELQKAAIATKTCIESDDGLLVSGEKFFTDFQVDEEAA